jgi:predicted component of type VI protein secretion system
MLKLGKLKADHLCVRFADGTLIDTITPMRCRPC